MKKTLLFLIFFLTIFTTFAQNPADISQVFGSISGFSGEVKTTVIQPDGKIIVGGLFAFQNGSQYGLIRLNSDGSKDDSFDIGKGFDDSVSCISLQKDGKILIAGDFKYFQGKFYSGIIRLNSDGSVDTSFNILNGFVTNSFEANCIKSMVLQPDGKIVLGGGFSYYQGKSQNFLIRLNSDGSKDNSFIVENPNIVVNAIGLQSDGKLIIGGQYLKNKTQQQDRLIRLNIDGSRDVTFTTASGFNNNINAITILSDNRILVGGAFGGFLARLSSNGIKDDLFSSQVNFSYNVYPYTCNINVIKLQSDEKIIIGGIFSSYQGSARNYLTRINSDGSIDKNFKIADKFDFPDVKSIAIQNDGKIIAGGNFPKFEGVTQNRLIRLNLDGTKDISFRLGHGFDEQVECISRQSDGKIVVGGNFISYDEIQQNKLIRFNADGTKDKNLNIGSGFGVSATSGSNCRVLTITALSDGKLILGGTFGTYQDKEYPALIRLNSNGTPDTSFNTGSGLYSGTLNHTTVNSIKVQSDGKILVGGYFTRYHNTVCSNLIRLNPNGSIDTTFKLGTGFDSNVLNIVLQPDGKILVCGYFKKYQGIESKYLIRLNSDGTVDNSFKLPSELNIGSIITMCLQNDGKILIGASGTYTSSGGLIRLNEDGSIDSSFNKVDLNGTINSIVIQNDKKIIVGGYFQNKLARYNSDGIIDQNFNVGTSFQGSAPIIKSMVLEPNGQIYVGGWFLGYQDDNRSAHLIKLKGNEVVLSNEDFIKENKSFSLWPNPVKNTLNINSLNESNYSVKIYDLLGRLIYTKENVNTSIDVSSFTSGLYLIKIKAENGEASQKFIKI
ncbi:T9SS type A sorting domain-containing protein [Flavobacterium zhairuonense]|uniref:T9SS type A sorting domain-containing protein n=1 Tax=Flavobacterium zhairuonense TaxID=2493631 RepID=UPI00104A11A5|nr:T9SS type A sorting domain-containing protein [Flavobacterium zhairuonense]KAF2514085.1 T9SS type A sorting domain-containing protein [Flavobacterium zhairuonense]